MMDSPVTASSDESNDKPKSTSRVTVTKDEAMNMSVGSNVSLKISGEVKSLQRSYDDENSYDVEIEDPQISEVKSDKKKKKDDSNLATMDRGDLKKKITPKDDSDDSEY